MFKFGHTFILGLILAPMYERRGLGSCILFHLAFNSAGLIIAFSPKLIDAITTFGELFDVIFVVFTCTISFFLLKTERHKNHEIELLTEKKHKKAA